MTTKITERIDSVTDCSHWLKVPTPFPKSVKIELNSNCNYKCSFCATSLNLRTDTMMDRKLFEKIIDELARINMQEVGLFYLGEPFLCPWLHEAIEYVANSGIPFIFLTTNGSALTKDKLTKCLKAGLDSLKFSLNFADSEQFTEMTKINGRVFDRVKENIKMAHEVREETGSKCGIYASCIRYNDEQVDRMKPLLEELNPYLDEFYWLPLYNHGGYFDTQTVAGNVGRHDMQRSGTPCWSVFSAAHVTFDGKLTACCFDHKNQFAMGDLNNESFVDAWNSPEFIELRKHHIKGELKGSPCANCLLLGGCE